MVDECNKELNNKNEICSAASCTGCSACLNICPVDCISMQKDDYDEIHPVIDYTKCKKCNLCKKVCPNNRNYKLYVPEKCYAGVRKDKIKIEDSSSGGICTVLSEKFITEGNIVYGVKFDRKNGAEFCKAETFDDIISFKGSKYVQANVNYIYREILKDLKKGKKVLFIGSPCQVAGLKAYINVKNKQMNDNLFTVDFLCHGTVPNKYLLDEIDYIEKKEKNECDEISFRSNNPNKNYYLCLLNNGKIFYKKKAEKERYFFSFLHSISLRESCLHCHYKKVERSGDITLGDFIGLGMNIPFSAKNEVQNPSLILINTSKGKEAINSIAQEIKLWERTLDEAIKGGPSLRGGARCSKLRKKFRKMYPHKGFVKTAKYTTTFAIGYDTLKKYIRKVKNKLKT